MGRGERADHDRWADEGDPTLSRSGTAICWASLLSLTYERRDDPAARLVRRMSG